MTLPQELHTRCRAILLHCSEFDNYHSLQAIFVTTELRIFQSRLPQAPNREEQVTQTIAYLIQQRLSSNRPVFPLFLAELRNRRYEGDALRDDLDHLCIEVEQKLKKLDHTDIPFVTIAMTAQEAQTLIDETVFNNPTVAQAEHEAFRQLKAVFPDDDIANWLTHYAEARDEWQPLACQGQTIQAIITTASGRHNQSVATAPNLSLIHPQFFSADFLSLDNKKRIETWEYLSQTGCVMIIDAITLFHPLIYRQLLQSELSSNRNVAIAMLVLSPEANELIEQELESRLQRAFARFDRYDDKLCQLDVGQQRDLRRWLIAALPEMAQKTHLTLHPNGRQMMQQRVNQTHGMSSIISGRGW